MAIHPTAIVDSKAEIHESVEIGPYCVIDANVKVHAGCKLEQNVYLTGWTEIGENCVIHPGVIIGHEPQDVKYSGERTYCCIGKNNVFREYVTIHRGTVPESETRVGDDCFLLANSHVAHNCMVGNNVTMINGVLLAGHVEIGDRVTVGGGAGVHQFSRIGDLAMIAGMAAVRMDVVPYALVDEDGRIAGLNRVGLKRAGLAAGEVLDIRRAYRVLFGKTANFAQACEELAAKVTTSAGRKIAEFVARDSRRGFAGRS